MIRFLQAVGTIVMLVLFTLALVYVAFDMFYILSALIWVHQ